MNNRYNNLSQLSKIDRSEVKNFLDLLIKADTLILWHIPFSNTFMNDLKIKARNLGLSYFTKYTELNCGGCGTRCSTNSIIIPISELYYTNSKSEEYRRVIQNVHSKEYVQRVNELEFQVGHLMFAYGAREKALKNAKGNLNDLDYKRFRDYITKNGILPNFELLTCSKCRFIHKKNPSKSFFDNFLIKKYVELTISELERRDCVIETVPLSKFLKMEDSLVDYLYRS
jgi:hypothetical protein